MTTAEILISITCLEFSYTQAPPRLKSLIMGLYLCSVSLGNLFTAGVNWWMEKSPGALSGAGYYWFFVKCMSVTAVLFVFVSLFYKGRTYLQDDQSSSPSH
jgi:POT family proton-dependent oligopeptide transporter